MKKDQSFLPTIQQRKEHFTRGCEYMSWNWTKSSAKDPEYTLWMNETMKETENTKKAQNMKSENWDEVPK